MRAGYRFGRERQVTAGRRHDRLSDSRAVVARPVERHRPRRASSGARAGSQWEAPAPPPDPGHASERRAAKDEPAPGSVASARDRGEQRAAADRTTADVT
ncbi:hypothetical protein NUM_08300 [Actinocatenispora comari]|uniref:Uncharacterized protein n=1 Tax=Actinocatenispora comari TaxID=2807577 RepID=A0A8J4A637_9ACTN|nr:hypothetical protein NUM_08300 [Actinocatenispora comari]